MEPGAKSIDFTIAVRKAPPQAKRAVTPIARDGPRSAWDAVMRNRNAMREARPRREPRADKLTFDGEVIETLPNAMFRVQADNGLVVLATLAGRMRRNWVRVLLGDRVTVEVTPYEPTRGRITYRLRS